ncbi:hypothetical protein MPSEU_000963800 [Mayamaea pseudoterrestris]|nr:hypothetical protein MPSEU_000963800 [Mayamaea pseudoterrestris]
MSTMMLTRIATFAFVLFSAVQALDFEITGFDCDENLYITATDLSIKCDGNSRCSFGSSVATVAGTLNYNKVYNTGIVDNIGYLSSDMELVTLQYQFFDKAQIPLCSDGLTATTDDAACPGDGSYQFSVEYNLPSAGNEHQSWLASGWNGNGVIQIFAEADENMLIGECTFVLDTFVTPATEANFYSRTVNPPSAAATVGIVMGALAVLGLICLYCYCCRRKSKVLADTDDEYYVPTNASKQPDDVSAFFKRLDDETGSAPPTSITAPTITTQSIGSSSRALTQDVQEVPRRKIGSRFFSSLGRKKANPSTGMV